MAFIASRCVGTCWGNIDGVIIAGELGLALERGYSPGSRFVPGNWPRRKTVWPRDDTARFKVRFACGGLCACIRRISAGFRDRGTIPKVLEVLAVAQGCAGRGAAVTLQHKHPWHSGTVQVFNMPALSLCTSSSTSSKPDCERVLLWQLCLC